MDKDQGATVAGGVAAIGTVIGKFLPVDVAWVGELLQVLGIAVLGWLTNKK